jgi:hypothetical protein
MEIVNSDGELVYGNLLALNSRVKFPKWLRSALWTTMRAHGL